MPESKSNSTKPTAKKRAAESKPATKKPASTSKPTTMKKSAAKSAPASSKGQRKISDVKPVKNSGATKSSTKATPAKTKSTSAKKPAAKKPASVKKPAAKKTGKVIDSFTIPVDHSKTTPGNTDMDWSDLEKSVEAYDSPAEELSAGKSKKSPKPEKKVRAERASQPETKSRKVFRIIGIILAGILSLSTIVLGGMVITINLLPEKYLILAIIVLVILALGLSATMVARRVKPAIKIPVFAVSTLFSIIYIVGIIYLNQTFNFFSSLHGQDYISEKYYVLVNKDSEYQNIHDLRDKTIATYNEDIPVYHDAIKQLNTFVKADLKDVDAISALQTSLAEHEVDATFISAVHLAMLDETTAEQGTKFSDSTRTIHTIEVKVATDAEADHPDIDIATQPFTVFISGIDSYGDISNMTRGRSDVNMLVTVNPNTHEVLLTSIPRDYYVQLHGTTGTRDKLTHAGIYGVQMSMQTLEDLLGIDINYYLKVNFSTVTKLVDTIGGIDVYSDQEIRPLHGGGKVIPKGNVHMDGAMALAFARERKSYATGDRHRVQNQQDVISAIIKKVSSSSVILTKYSEILSDLADCLSTNVGKDEISSLVKLQLRDMPSWQIGQYSLNGKDAHGYTYSMGQQMLYVMEPNLETVQTAHDNITGLIEGKPLSELKLNK